MTEHRPTDHGFAGFDAVLVIFDQTTILHQPGNRALDNPALGLHHKAFLIGGLGDNLQRPVVDVGGPVLQKTAIGAVGKHNFEPFAEGFELRKNRLFQCGRSWGKVLQAPPTRR